MSAAKKVVTLLRQQWTTWCEADQLLEGAAKQAKDLAALLDRTVAHAESNSQLITGQRGCGKTAVLNAALRELTKKYADQSRPPYLVVHLDGQVLTEDRAALQEIAWQLAVEQQLERQTFGSFAETLAFLLKTLRKSDAKETTPVIFILNEIDQFALHPKQTLLYNLFDIVQSQSSPIAVVGVTCRLDFLELLEKRVKSRFSHRTMEVKPLENIESFYEIVERHLLLPASATATGASSTSGSKPKGNAVAASSVFAAFAQDYTAQVLALRKDETYLSVIQGAYELTRDVSSLLRLVFVVVSSMASCSEDGLAIKQISGAQFQAAATSMAMDGKVQLLLGVSLLELALVIAMNRVVVKREQPVYNFEMVYQEYREFMSKHTSVSVELYSKPVAFKAFEQLLVREVIRHVGKEAVAGYREYSMVTLHLDTAQIESAVEQREDCPTFLKRWATQWTD